MEISYKDYAAYYDYHHKPKHGEPLLVPIVDHANSKGLAAGVVLYLVRIGKIPGAKVEKGIRIPVNGMTYDQVREEIKRRGPILTGPEVAALLSVHPRAISRWTESGILHGTETKVPLRGSRCKYSYNINDVVEIIKPMKTKPAPKTERPRKVKGK